MRYSIVFGFVGLFFIILFSTGCKTSSLQSSYNNPQWFNIAVADGVEIYIDTANIERSGALVYAFEKRVYVNPESKKLYTDKIKQAYHQLGRTDKASKWDDFSYCIYRCEYECVNQRFRVLSVEDYDSHNQLIIRTTNSKSQKWLHVEPETVGDHTFFYVCDYNQ